MIEKTELYVVEKGDTLEKIADKTNCKIEDIIRLNNIKVNNLFEGKPLIVSSNYRNIKQTINNVLYATKECILSIVYFEDGYDVYYEKINNALIEIDDNIRIRILDLIKDMLNFPRYIIKKDDVKITLFEKSTKKKIDEIKESTNNIYLKSIFGQLSDKGLEMYELFIVEFLSKKYEKAELTYNNLRRLFL